MSTLSKLLLFVLVCAVSILAITHAEFALRPALPNDMPAESQFLESGYDINHLEPKGEWVGCTDSDSAQAAFCRVTDAHGVVVFQGDFLPLNRWQPLQGESLQPHTLSHEQLWVHGPAEQSPVPVIRLASGALLVPTVDRDALADRWAGNPQELHQIVGQ